MTIPRTVPMGLLLTLPLAGALFLPKHCALFSGQTLFAKALLAYGLMVLLVLAAMAAFGAGRWRDFGFQAAQGPWLKFLLYALLLGAVSTLAIKCSPGKGMEASLKGLKSGQMVFVLIVASVTEELLVRGWLQGFLQPLQGRVVKLGPARISVPVLTGALAFGAMHLPAGLGIDAWTTVLLLLFTTSLGFLAGLARERKGSLLPAVWVHVGGNAGGIVGGLLFILLQKAIGVHPPRLG